jgi:hypothetical protein
MKTILASFLFLLVLQTHASDPATVAFTLDFPASDPAHYSISVRSDGHVTYESKGKISTDSNDREPFQGEFTLTEATRAQIFDLAARAKYFSGKVDSGNKKLAFTGQKKLTYSDGQRNTTATYNFSQQAAVQQLTTLFAALSATLEFGRRLTYDHRYQKLALDEELKNMEREATGGGLAELQAVKPILQAIYDDQSVINVVRARAQRIVEMGDGH